MDNGSLKSHWSIEIPLDREWNLDKKGLRQCAKLQDLGEGLIVIFTVGNKVKSYFVGFAQNPTLLTSHKIDVLVIFE